MKEHRVEERNCKVQNGEKPPDSPPPLPPVKARVSSVGSSLVQSQTDYCMQTLHAVSAKRDLQNPRTGAGSRRSPHTHLFSRHQRGGTPAP